MRRSLPALLAFLALALPAVARADADPASDTLYTGRVFLPLSGKVSPRRDAVDEKTGNRLTDVLVFRVDGEDLKELMLNDERGIFFTTPHWNGYPAVLMRIKDLRRLRKQELEDLVAEAWLTKVQKRVARAWLAEHSSDQ